MLDIKQNHEKVLYPTCRVRAEKAGGSGTVIYSKPDSKNKAEHLSFILTNHHVVEESIKIKEDWDSVIKRNIRKEFTSPVTVEIFRYSYLSKVDSSDARRADIVAYDKTHDLALLKLDSPFKQDYVAEIIPANEIKDIRLFTPIWSVGASLLHDPFANPGYITYLNEVIENKKYFMSNCLTGDTLVRLCDGTEATMEALSYKTEPYYVYGLDSNLNVVPTLASPAKVTGNNVEVFAVELDNGVVIKATENHLFMMRDGSYKSVRDLKVTESLMPFYRKISTKGLKDYEIIYSPGDNKWHYTHKFFSGIIPRGKIVPHKNFNHKDNSPNNFSIITQSEHAKIHIKKVTERMKNKTFDEIYGLEKSKIISDKMRAARVGKKPWQFGKTKEQYPQIGNGGRKAGFKGFSVLKGMTYEEYFGEEKSAKIRGKQSKSQSERVRSEEEIKRCKKMAYNMWKIREKAIVIQKMCPVCNKTFEVKGADKQQFCGKKCSAISRGFTGIPVWRTRNQVANVLNHKIVSIKSIGMVDRVYDITTGTHNFALSKGEIFVHNCNSIFGNSGGGVYLADNGYFIGVPSRISAIQIGFGVDIITWMGFFTAPQRVYEFLEEQDLRFIFDGKEDYYACMEKRRKKQKKSIIDFVTESKENPEEAEK